jgi:Zn-dependent protease
MELIFSIVILVMSVVVHEVSHGYAANALGDPTARYAGRLTLNPLKHLDVFGSVIFPLLLFLSHTGFIFGWAKPVPVNPYNFKNQRYGEAMTAAAGPLANIFLAAVFGLLMRLNVIYGFLSVSFMRVSAMVVVTNIVLAVFNLIPLPPFDGSKIFFDLLPGRFSQAREFIERYSFILVIIAVLFIWELIAPIIPVIFRLLTGIAI